MHTTETVKTTNINNSCNINDEKNNYMGIVYETNNMNKSQSFDVT